MSPAGVTLEPGPPVAVGGVPSWTVSWLGADTVALADTEEQTVVIADLATGKLRSVGRRGDGPGEFRGVIPPLRGAGGRLLVPDLVLRRLNLFGPDLRWLGSHATPVLIGQILAWTGDSILATWYAPFEQMAPRLGWIRLPEGPAEPRAVLALDSLLLALGDPGLMPPLVVAAARDRLGNVYVADGRSYRIVRIDPALRQARVLIRRELPPEPQSADEIARTLASMRRAAGGVTLPPGIEQQLLATLQRTPRPFFSANGLSVDEAGRLWVVSTRQRHGATEVDVFDAEGRLLGTHRLRGVVRSLAWRGRRAAALVEPDDEGAGVIDVYRASR